MSDRSMRRVLWLAIGVVAVLMVLDVAGVLTLSPGWVRVELTIGYGLILVFALIRLRRIWPSREQWRAEWAEVGKAWRRLVATWRTESRKWTRR